MPSIEATRRIITKVASMRREFDAQIICELFTRFVEFIVKLVKAAFIHVWSARQRFTQVITSAVAAI